ncbi:DUF6157 family protein [Micromonospora cremea]|uniref:Uncharacterized protein n=1 Tax=Micromonospora cremea TaxID=709881 RepID=A0A1N5UUS0_9ACTN|nr:DUF6157 family protein [Micromonospora cremea]SIM64250.1 hypothetical protein SAMN04489832_1159 [Micromonospora cremea]
MHSTNYVDTFIQVAEDSTASSAAAPPARATPGIAELTFRMIFEAPYRYTSDEVVFTVWAERRGIPEAERAAAREEFFAKGQPCLRASDLGKRYGWGVHADSAGRVALVPLGSTEYAQLAGGGAADGRSVTVTRAMRTSRRGSR